MSSLALADKLEKDWDFDLFNAKKGLAPMLGWDSYWTFRSKGSRPGFPDRTVVKERILYVELKRELTGRKSEDANRQPSAPQRAWLDRLARGGGEVYLWRPSDLDEIARILGKPWGFFRFVGGRFSFDKPPHLATAADGAWVPRSIWVPGVGRADEAGVT